MTETTVSCNNVYQALGHLANTNIVAAFSSRSFGNMSLSYGDLRDSLNNRREFLSNLGIDYQNLVCAKQIHASIVRYVEEKDRGKGALSYDTAIANTDAFITDKRNLPLAVFTADCLSIFLYDPAKSAIGLVHAGWRSSRENIVAQTIELMQGKFNTQVEDLYVGFGPAIRSCCYRIGTEFRDFFPEGIIERRQHYYLDLVGINKRQVLNAGAKEEKFFDSQICTSCRNADFFSYRKEGNACGRMISVTMLL